MTDKTIEQISEEEKGIKAILNSAWNSYYEKKAMLHACLRILSGSEADRIAAAYVAGYSDGHKAKENADA